LTCAKRKILQVIDTRLATVIEAHASCGSNKPETPQAGAISSREKNEYHSVTTLTWTFMHKSMQATYMSASDATLCVQHRGRRPLPHTFGESEQDQ
jgi:hypothetical protein